MKEILTYLLFITAAVLFISCSEGKSKRGLMPELKTADSAAVMYYDTANNPRFFKYTKVMDMQIMVPFFRDANRRTIRSGEDCLTRGKIYFYGKGGVVYTVYFSDTKDCMTLSFIITGEKYYTKLSSEAGKLLMQWQKQAKAPVNPD